MQGKGCLPLPPPGCLTLALFLNLSEPRSSSLQDGHGYLPTHHVAGAS